MKVLLTAELSGFIPLACVAAGPRTRLNHLYSLYTEGLECLRRRLHTIGVHSQTQSLKKVPL